MAVTARAVDLGDVDEHPYARRVRLLVGRLDRGTEEVMPALPTSPQFEPLRRAVRQVQAGTRVEWEGLGGCWARYDELALAVRRVGGRARPVSRAVRRR